MVKKLMTHKSPGRPPKPQGDRAVKMSITLPKEVYDRLHSIKKYDPEVESISQVINEALERGKTISSYKEFPAV